MSATVREIVLRAACGFAGSVLAGYVTFDVAGVGGARGGGFRETIFDPGRLASQCVSVGLIAALVFALVRAGRASACLAVAVAWSALMLGQAIGAGGGVSLVVRPFWALALAAGLFLAALVFDALAGEGFRAGKFLITAPLVAGFYLAAAPAVLADVGSGSGLFRELMMFALIGLVIGNGTGFGVEVAEMFLPAAPARGAPADDPGN